MREFAIRFWLTDSTDLPTGRMPAGWLLAATMILFSGTIAATEAVTQEPRSEPHGPVTAAASDPLQSLTVEDAAAPQRHVLIVVGLAGDEEHRERFQTTVALWRDWLITHVGVQEDQITILSGREPSGGIRPGTAEDIRAASADLASRAREQDSVWVFLVGHGSQDPRDGWFHLPGPDLSATAWADLFVPLKAAEQVFWLTHSASGSFLKPMSRPGRVVITATDPDGEVNETRFPHALAEVMQRDLADSADDSSVAPRSPTVLGLFQATARHVLESFEQDRLVPTEHAQLDDNGDGQGTEADELAEIRDVQSAEPITDEDSNLTPEHDDSDATIDAARAPLDGLRSGQTMIDMTTWFPYSTAQVYVAAASSRSDLPNNLRLEATATEAMRIPKNPAG